MDVCGARRLVEVAWPTRGAAGVGELDDKGQGLVRVGEKAYFIDDARFDSLWDEAGRLHVAVFVHIAEPAAFYDRPHACAAFDRQMGRVPGPYATPRTGWAGAGRRAKAAGPGT
jgi:hypothetical protein